MEKITFKEFINTTRSLSRDKYGMYIVNNLDSGMLPSALHIYDNKRQINFNLLSANNVFEPIITFLISDTNNKVKVYYVEGGVTVYSSEQIFSLDDYIDYLPSSTPYLKAKYIIQSVMLAVI